MSICVSHKIILATNIKIKDSFVKFIILLL
jgi:hypothetical protein